MSSLKKSFIWTVHLLALSKDMQKFLAVRDLEASNDSDRVWTIPSTRKHLGEGFPIDSMIRLASGWLGYAISRNELTIGKGFYNSEDELEIVCKVEADISNITGYKNYGENDIKQLYIDEAASLRSGLSLGSLNLLRNSEMSPIPKLILASDNTKRLGPSLRNSERLGFRL